MASVRVDELLLSDDTREVALDLPDDRFYLSIASYVRQTHETGDVLVDEQMETFANGFVGLWLPRDIEGTIEVSSEGRRGEVRSRPGTRTRPV